MLRGDPVFILASDLTCEKFAIMIYDYDQCESKCKYQYKMLMATVVALVWYTFVLPDMHGRSLIHYLQLNTKLSLSHSRRVKRSRTRTKRAPPPIVSSNYPIFTLKIEIMSHLIL